jgi:hypothetical protein
VARSGLRGALVGLLLLGVGLAVLLANPRHRAFYLGAPGAGGPPSEPATLSLVSPPALIPRVSRRIDAPLPIARVPTEQEARVHVPVSDRVPARLPANGVPAGWEMRAFTAGDAAVELVRDEGRVAVRLRSDRNSFALHRDVVVDLRHHPVLTWRWKVTRLPTGGDVRDAGRDDQAAQVYVVFPRWPSPRTTSDVIGYVWDARTPAGTTLAHPKAPNVRIVVLQSGAGRLGSWVREQRNVAEDYRALFGRRPPRVGKIALMIDSNDTRSQAEAMFGDLTFGRVGAPEHSEIPTTMLR